MAIALKLDSTTEYLRQFEAADALQVQSVEARNASANLTIGDNLAATYELRLGASGRTVRVLGDLAVDGTETITSTTTANGDVNLGDNSGDTINLGGGTNDTVNLEADLVLGAGSVGIGSSVTDYLSGLWIQAVNDAGPDNDAYDLRANGTNAGAYGIGVDPSLIGSSSATDLMSMLNDMDDAISGGAGTMQATYETGNTIDVTSAYGIFDIENSTNTDTTTVLKVHRAPTSSTAGIGLEIDMGANTTGVGASIIAAGSGDALLVNNTGPGDAIDIQDGGSSVLQITGAGALNLTPTSGQNAVVTAAGAGVVDINSGNAVQIDAAAASNFTVAGANLTLSTTTSGAILLTSAGAITASAGAASSISTTAGNLSLDSAAGELVFDDVGNSGLTLSQTSDRTLDQTGSGEVLNGVTSIIGGLNALADAVDAGGSLIREDPIVNGVTITAGDCVAASTTSGRVTQANANSNTNGRFVGIALNTGTGDVGGTVICRYALPGSHVTDSGASFTAGDALFMPDGTGRPTATAPSGAGDLVRRVGWALTSTTYIQSVGPGIIL